VVPTTYTVLYRHEFNTYIIDFLVVYRWKCMCGDKGDTLCGQCGINDENPFESGNASPRNCPVVLYMDG
jgi:hypothetical protein